jgi:hypothetical protein
MIGNVADTPFVPVMGHGELRWDGREGAAQPQLQPEARNQVQGGGDDGAKDISGNGLDQNPGAAGNQQKVWFFTPRN